MVTLNVEELIRTTDRFKGADWFSYLYKTVVQIVGVGGIGSWTALSISSAVKSLCIWDDDVVEVHNIGGQFYNYKDCGSSKTHALSSKLKVFSPSCFVKANNKKFDRLEKTFKTIIISAVDNMKTRKELFLKFLETKDSLFIDGRMESELFQIFCVDRNNNEAIEAYKKTLFDDNAIPDAPCNYKATRYVGMMIGSLIQQYAANWAANKVANFEIKELPFKTTYIGPMLEFKTYSYADIV